MLNFLDQGLALRVRPYGRLVYFKAALWVLVVTIVLEVFLALALNVLIAANFQFADYEPAKGRVIIIFGLIFYILLSYLFYQITKRRAQDAGVSKYLAWLTVIPFVQYAVIVAFCLFPSKK